MCASFVCALARQRRAYAHGVRPPWAVECVEYVTKAYTCADRHDCFHTHAHTHAHIHTHAHTHTYTHAHNYKQCRTTVSYAHTHSEREKHTFRQSSRARNSCPRSGRPPPRSAAGQWGTRAQAARTHPGDMNGDSGEKFVYMCE